MHDWETLWLWKLKGKVHAVRKEFCQVNIGFFYADWRKHDIDSRIKPILDLFEKLGAYKNDNVVTGMIVTKGYDKKNPRAEVSVY